MSLCFNKIGRKSPQLVRKLFIEQHRLHSVCWIFSFQNFYIIYIVFYWQTHQYFQALMNFKTILLWFDLKLKTIGKNATNKKPYSPIQVCFSFFVSVVWKQFSSLAISFTTLGVWHSSLGIGFSLQFTSYFRLKD